MVGYKRARRGAEIGRGKITGVGNFTLRLAGLGIEGGQGRARWANLKEEHCAFAPL